MLHRPEPGIEFRVHTDASESGLGTILKQKIEERERTVAYASRALEKNETNYSVTEKGCIAVKWAIEKFRPYIEETEFTVITDHAALQWLFNKKNPTGRLGKWAGGLMGYDFKVIHKKGAQNVVPDALS